MVRTFGRGDEGEDSGGWPDATLVVSLRVDGGIDR